jgi:hypothetical protein
MGETPRRKRIIKENRSTEYFLDFAGTKNIYK